MRFLDLLIGKPSVAYFAAQMIEAFRSAGDTSQLRYDAAENRIIRENSSGRDGETNLGDMYHTYLLQPRTKRAAYVRSAAVSLLNSRKGLPEDFDLVRADLRPKLWLRATFEQMRLQNLVVGVDDKPLEMPLVGVGEHLSLGLAYDWPQSVQTINDDNLKTWNVSFYEALEVASRNLDEATTAYAELGKGTYAFVSADTYDATRIILLDRIRALEVNGKHIALAAGRDSLTITGSEDEAGLAIVAGLGSKALERPYDLSGVPLILEDGEWRDWKPPRDHSLYRTFCDLELMFVAPLYGRQKYLLDAVHEKHGIDIYVGELSVLRKNDGSERISYCTWPEGVDSLLPAAQYVGFVEDGNVASGTFGEWDRVMEFAGHLLEATDDYPRRYRAREFPNDTILDAIGLHKL
jgi:hypothetical protein